MFDSRFGPELAGLLLDYVILHYTELERISKLHPVYDTKTRNCYVLPKKRLGPSGLVPQVYLS